MSRFIILIFSLSLITCSQSSKIPADTDLARVYSMAVEDFIKAANKKNAVKFDTIYIAKRNYGQPDDFPNIELPDKIANTQVRLITPEAGIKSQKENNSRIYINMMGWLNNDKAQFLFYVFSNGFIHQYNCSLNYTYRSSRKKYELEQMHFQDPSVDK